VIDDKDLVQMTVGGVTLDPVTKTPVVLLKDEREELTLPIWVGLLEATSMATELEGVKMARPMTHDLLKRIV
jgi:bifunctional DNase/RNase